jgi:uncharacterized protein involved in exopolysaccharide biosynthesis
MQFLRIIWARRIIVLVSTFSALLGAFLISEMLPRRYQAQSRLLLDMTDPVSGETIAANAARSYIKTQENLLRDARIVGGVVDQLGLTSDFSLQQEFLKSGSANQSEFRAWIARRIIENTQAKVVEASNILEITYSGSNPQRVAQIANALRDAYVTTTSSFRRDAARRTADWYDQQTQKAQMRLSEAEAAKTQYERQHGLVLQGDTDLDSARLQALAGASAPVSSGAPAAGAPSRAPSSSAASAQLGQAEAALAQASQTLGPNHPELQELQRRRAALAAQVAQERASFAQDSAASNAAAGAASRAAAAGSGAGIRAYEAQKSRVMAQRDKLDRLRQLQTDVDVRRDQYTKTLMRTAELRQQADTPAGGLTLLGSAVTPESPVYPNVPLILLGGFGFGFALGILIALLTELLARRVRGVEDMVRAVDVPLLAVIGSPEQKLLEPARRAQVTPA